MVFPENIKHKGVGPGVVLDKERENASFRIEDLAVTLYGGAERLREQRKIQALLHKDPVFSKKDAHNLSRDELYVRGLQVSEALLSLTQKENLNEKQFSTLYSELDMLLQMNLHRTMFVPSLEQQLTEKQKKKWMPLVKSYEVIGTYAQTELGHGSFVRGLETTATFDEKSDEFVMNTPTLTSMKWWPGNLGKSSNHCVVMAQLMVKGKNYGLQGFIVPIRDMKTHKPLAGVEVGDIGPKFGYDMIDNGYLRLKNVRIPRENMLMQFQTLDKNGKFKASENSKILYATMVLTRVNIIGGCSKYLAKAATIAARYSAVRRQFPSAEGSHDEVQVLDYQTQQQKVLPQLAASYAIYATYLWLADMYHNNTSRVGKGDFSMMAELHAVASCLKGLCTEICLEGMEICRRSCGGHGYMKFSGIVDIYQNYVPSATYEGENTVLYLQTARYLVKHGKSALSGKKLPDSLSAAYLCDERLVKETCKASTPDSFANVDLILEILRARAVFIVFQTLKGMNAKTKGGMTDSQAWDNSLVNLTRCSQAHALVMIISCASTFLKKIETAPEVRTALNNLLTLFGAYHIEKCSGDLLESGYLSAKQVYMCREYCHSTLSLLRRDTVALGDAWDFSDYTLNSALGRYDGNVYQALYDWAKESRLNIVPVDTQFRKYFKPLKPASNL